MLRTISFINAIDNDVEIIKVCNKGIINDQDKFDSEFIYINGFSTKRERID